MLWPVVRRVLVGRVYQRPCSRRKIENQEHTLCTCRLATIQESKIRAHTIGQTHFWKIWRCEYSFNANVDYMIHEITGREAMVKQCSARGSEEREGR